MMESFMQNNISKKQDLINQMIFKVVEEGKISSNLKPFFYKDNFLGEYSRVCKELIKRSESNEMPTEEYIRKAHNLIQLNPTTMTQKDISELLKEQYIQEMFTVEFIKKTQSIKSGNMADLKNFLEYCSSTLVEMENVTMVSFGDKDVIEKTLHQIKDRSDIVTFGSLQAFNDLEMRKQQLIGILASSGSGKSLVLEKLHAESKNDVVLHFSLELPKSLFLRRMFVALNWVSDDQIEYLSNSQVSFYARKMASEFPHWYFTCLDTDSNSINCNKIDKMCRYYRNKHPNKTIKVIIDYVQLLEESFDALTCRVNKDLHNIAVKHDVCMIEGMQANDEASKYEHPAETSMIAFVKSLKNDCDIIQSFKGVALEESPHKTILTSKTVKHRMGKPNKFVYLIDHYNRNPNVDSWRLERSSRQVSKNINLEEGTNNKFDEENED